MNQTSIYALHDPRDFAIRYVGKANDPENRRRAHMRRPVGMAMRRFVAELQRLGLELRVSVLQNCSQQDWAKWERFWIKLVRESGAELFNIANGGNAPATTSENCRAARLGKKDSPETRQRKSAAAPRVHSVQHSINAGLAQRGRKFSEEHKQKLRDAKLGTKLSTERVEKYRVSITEKWKDPIYRERVSAGLRESWRKRRQEE